MTERHVDAVDDLLAALQTELSVVPSPEFAPGVRARISARPAPGSWRLWMVPVVVAAGVAAIAIATVTMSRPLRAPREAVPVAKTMPKPDRTAAAGTAIGGHEVLQPTAPRRSNGAVKTVTTALPPTPVEPARQQPEVLVPDDQRRALVSVLASMRSRPSQVPPALAVVVDADGRLPAPDSLTISMIVIELLGPVPDWRRER